MNQIGQLVNVAWDTLSRQLGIPQLTWRGQTFNYVPGPQAIDSVLEIGGKQVNISQTILLQKRDFDTNVLDSNAGTERGETTDLQDGTEVLTPQTGKSIFTISSVDYRVIRVTDSPDGEVWTVDLAED